MSATKEEKAVLKAAEAWFWDVKPFSSSAKEWLAACAEERPPGAARNVLLGAVARMLRARKGKR